MSRHDAFSNEPALQARATSLRRSFAERHVLLTPTLSLQLAGLLAARAPVHAPRWGRCFTQMSRAVGSSGAFAGQQLLRGVMDRFLLVVTEPLLRRAAQDAELSAETVLLSPPDDETIARYEAALDRLLDDAEAMGRPFWLAAALDLAGNGREQAERRLRSGTSPSLFEVDGQIASLAFLHEPVFSDGSALKTMKDKARNAAAQRRSGLRPKEGGVAGIVQSRHYDDLPDALVSELILPKGLFINKFLQDGLLTRHRPPRRTPRRDLLAVTLMEAPAADPVARLLKALWADAGIRLRLALWQRGQGNSDLVWVDPASTSSLDCEIDLPGMETYPPLMISGKARADFLMRTGLFPGHARRAPATKEAADDAAALLHRALLPLSRAQQTSVSTLPRAYRRRFALICRPLARAADDWPALSGELKAELARPLPEASLAGLFWTPGPRSRPPRLTACFGRREPLDIDLPQSIDDLPEVAGAIVHWILDVTLESLDVRQT